MSQPSNPRHYSQSKRPASIAELAERATDNLWDENKALRRYLRMAWTYRCDGLEFVRTGDLESAFVQFAKAATLVLEKLPTHRDYYVLLKPAQRQNLGLNGQDILDNLSDLKPTLVDRFNKWLQEHPDGIDDEHTPNDDDRQPMLDDAQAQAAAQYREAEQRLEQRRLAAEEAARSKRHRKEQEEAMERNRKDAGNAARQVANVPQRSAIVDYGYSRPQQGSANTGVLSQQEEMRKREEEITKRRAEARRLQEQQDGIVQSLHEAGNAPRASRLLGPSRVRQPAFPQQTASSSSVYQLAPPPPSDAYQQQQQQRAPNSSAINHSQQQPPSSAVSLPRQQNGQEILDNLSDLEPILVDRFDQWLQARPDGIDDEHTPDAKDHQPKPDDAQAQTAALYREEEQGPEQRRLAAEEVARSKHQQEAQEEIKAAGQGPTGINLARQLAFPQRVASSPLMYLPMPPPPPLHPEQHHQQKRVPTIRKTNYPPSKKQYPQRPQQLPPSTFNYPQPQPPPSTVSYPLHQQQQEKDPPLTTNYPSAGPSSTAHSQPHSVPWNNVLTSMAIDSPRSISTIDSGETRLLRLPEAGFTPVLPSLSEN